ncbi:hypothetical protein ACLBXM_04480 [Xanthobacteraceae bacterium A53D]
MHKVIAAVVLAAALGLGLSGAAEAAPRTTKTEPATDARVWTIVKADDAFVLRYALPRAADPAFAATCQPSAQLLQIAVEVQNDQKIRSGDGVPLSLANGKRKLELAASAFLANAEGLLVVEAAVALEPRVFDLFRDGDTLVVRMPGSTQQLPLAGARTRLADFERVCLGRR